MTTQFPSAGTSATRAAVDWYARLTQFAFFLAIALVVARLTMTEMLRSPFDVIPGTPSPPRGTGPASTIVLDLFCCLPAILVLLRRLIDREYLLRFSLSFVPMALLGLLALASIKWADDKFAALVSGADFAAALALLWATAQLVRSWLRVRLVASICFGTMLVYIAQGSLYHFVDLPQLQEYWAQHKDDILKDQGRTADMFTAQQFEKNVQSGVMMGFNQSPNSFAAIIVLMVVITVGIVIQRLADKDSPGWSILMLLFLPLAGWIIYLTKCRAAYATPVLAMLMLAILWIGRRFLIEHARLAYFAVVLAFSGGVAFLVQHGIKYGTLFHDSLNFRWQYWVGCWRLFWRHPWIGGGWANFGLHYLSARLPEASEEIKDPHNFIIRFFMDLGVIGGVLLLAWMARLWWEWIGAANPARPVAAEKVPGKPPVARTKASRQAAVPAMLAIAGGTMAINILATIDWSQPLAALPVELLKRILFACALLIGALIANLRSLQRPELDDRPAPWALYGILAGVGVLLIHNLIEFGLFFEAGPMLLFALLGGTVLGIRLPASPSPQQRRYTRVVVITMIAMSLGWLVAFAKVAVPVLKAEDAAFSGDDNLRGQPAPDGKRVPSAALFSAAVSNYQDAFVNMPLNSDYASRWALALYYQHSSADEIISAYDVAIHANPAVPGYYLSRGRLEIDTNRPSDALADFQKAEELDPNNVQIHHMLGDALAKFSQNAKAKAEYQKALQMDDLLDPHNPKRLSSEQRGVIEKMMKSM